MHLALAANGVGAPLLGPPGMPNEATSILRSAYTEMVNSAEYRAAAAMRSIDVSKPNSGEALQRYVTTNLTANFPRYDQGIYVDCGHQLASCLAQREQTHPCSASKGRVIYPNAATASALQRRPGAIRGNVGSRQTKRPFIRGIPV